MGKKRLAVFRVIFIILLFVSSFFYNIDLTRAAAAQVQQVAAGNAGATTVAASWPGATTAGNLLVAVIAFRGGSAVTITPPAVTGNAWTLARRSDNGTTLTSAIYYINGANSQSGASTWTLGSSQKATLNLVEYSGVLASSALDQTALSSGTSTTASSGTTAATTQADEVAVVGISVANSGGTLSAWTNSFAAVNNTSSTGGGGASRNATYLASKILSATGAQTTSATVSSSLAWAGAIATFKAKPTYTQSAYRLFANTDTTDVGAALAAQDTAATLTTSGQSFRLRALMHVVGSNLGISGENFKLQYVDRGTGTCAAPAGGIPAAYTDVSASTLIAYKNNTPADGAALTANGSDPTHGADTIVNQSYEELNNFTNAQGAINAGQDGKWDFALYDNDAFSNTTYCLRIVKSDGTALSTYSVYPTVTTSGSICTGNELIGTDSSASTIVYNVRRSVLGTTIPSKNLGSIAGIASYSAARRASDGLVFVTQRGAGAGLNTMYSFNTTTGTSSLIGTIGSSVPDIYRLAFNGSNVLYAMDNNNVLYTLNQSTAAPTTVCNPVTGTGLVTGGGGDFAFSANGTLYLMSNNTTNYLYTINIGTCTATQIGTTGLTTFASIAFDQNDVLYGARYTGQDLYTINKSTGAPTLIAAFSPAITLYDFASSPNRAPNAPTLVSPANGSSTTDTTPTLSANYSDPDGCDTGTTNYRIATSAANCLAGTVVASGTSSATATNNENTTWTPGSSIGSDGTYYWCAQNNDGNQTTAWTILGNFILDTIPPTVSSTSIQSLTTMNVTFSEPMGTGVTTPANFAISESGQGTLAMNPNSVTLVSGNTYLLTWTSGSMVNAADTTVTVTNAHDVAGNVIGSPNYGHNLIRGIIHFGTKVKEILTAVKYHYRFH
jgi:hypothetical protein